LFFCYCNADDLFLVAEKEMEQHESIVKWKAEMEVTGMHVVNTEKTKVMFSCSRQGREAK